MAQTGSGAGCALPPGGHTLLAPPGWRGQTLSVDTLFDSQEQHSMADFRGQRMLANISPYFAEEVDAILEATGENRRDVLFGAHVTPLSRKSYFL
jgi:hypothetical protein